MVFPETHVLFQSIKCKINSFAQLNRSLLYFEYVF
uniref:Uncharacterized protein n=1 Tax=Anguilla anguilla TaxID=7936 RepID=A0A0E9QVS1_ANGAN